MTDRESFHRFTSALQEALRLPLPGHEVQYRLASPRRKDFPDFPETPENAKKSSVLLLLFPDGSDIRIVFIQRPLYDGVHSGQIAFPGGKMEDKDQDLTQTALRETWEETGIPPDKIVVLGHLTELYIPPSNFRVLPVVGYVPDKPDYHPDSAEVEEIIEVRMRDLFQPGVIQEKEVYARGRAFQVPCYYIDKKAIWGATAMILSELTEIISRMEGPYSPATGA